ncbi:DinB family protein [Paenibacillus sp. M1]|uniref:DinB family protein n=1 Tax=Paenibacillus haidiansis TaxID=1574488 RepID=A0ABU7VQZ6_9BACL
MTSSLFTAYKIAVQARLHEMKRTAEAALEQLDETGLSWTPDQGSNSIAVIVKHMSGHMISRWTDIFTTDGEKPDRNREAEFIPDQPTRQALLERWERGWEAFLGQLEAIGEPQLLTEIYIYGKPLTVIEAIEKSLYHYAYHTGQIVYIAKEQLKDRWTSLS